LRRPPQRTTVGPTLFLPPHLLAEGCQRGEVCQAAGEADHGACTGQAQDAREEEGAGGGSRCRRHGGSEAGAGDPQYERPRPSTERHQREGGGRDQGRHETREVSRRPERCGSRRKKSGDRRKRQGDGDGGQAPGGAGFSQRRRVRAYAAGIQGRSEERGKGTGSLRGAWQREVLDRRTARRRFGSAAFRPQRAFPVVLPVFQEPESKPEGRKRKPAHDAGNVGKNDKAKKKKKIAGEEFSNSKTVDIVTYSTLAIGSRLLGRVAAITAVELTVSLPNHLTAFCPITAVSAAVTTAVERSLQEEQEAGKGTPDNLPDLAKLFRVGQWVRCVVTSLTTSSEVKGVSVKRRVEVSVDPELVNSLLTQEDLNPGLVRSFPFSLQRTVA
ncbi:MAG: hypothetical protein BJ554DRAFT_7727, partial [Olpidium bornovanus]